ncbi:TonB-dependent receptor plug domain-containing protein [Granulicella sp. 5B5]|uniref:TonB-dependent receptor n=1 Tax=Granulicella sp. 5B5 TaxID=1617967 RepID=UPI0015F529D0|nr:TonB-dependent receptor [Granulicella sp. 5B5]QMV19418.1 TonB-dependent receptor plug domain-containing protein [Granulicella sp. 5B5]
MLKTIRLGYLGLAVALLLGVAGAHAQTVTGAVTGEVTDSTGAVIPGATVVVQDTDTNVKTTVTSNAAGVYTARFLPIGHYKVLVSAQGFASQSTPAFALEINQTVELHTKLSVGSESTVNVTGTAPILNTTDGTIGTTFSENEVQNVPLEGRNFQAVTLLTPGVVSTDPTGLTGSNATLRSTTSNNLVSVNGNRGQANYYTLDGVDINEPQNNQIGYNPAPDALQEIKVISGNAPAIYGNVNGGDVVSVLKSGTNQFHGSAYAYLQNNKLNANSWENKFKGQPINRYTQTIFGGTIGGPIFHDKLFFFADYEGFRQPAATQKAYQVLTQAELNGDFSAIPFQLYNTQAYDAATNTYPVFQNNQIPVNNPVAKYLAAHPADYPTPNADPSPNTYLRQYEGTERGYNVNNQFDAKVDWTPEAKDRISGFYAQSRARNGSDTIFPISFPSISSYPTTLFGASWVHTFSSAIVNQFNAGFTRVSWNTGVPIDRLGSFGLSGDSVVGIPFGVQQFAGFTEMNISDASTIGNRGAAQVLIDNTFGYNDNLTIQRGKHLFTLGVQAVRYQQEYSQVQNAGALGFFQYNGVYTNNPNAGNPNVGAADFVLDAANQYGLQDGGEFGNRQWRAAGYIQDDWKALPNLTLNLGVRYEYDQPMTEANNKNANVLPLNGGTMEFAGSIPAGAPAGSIICPTTACYDPNYRQIMPRFGFAYQAAQNISIRGGYGATSFLEGNAANQRLTDNPPLVSAFQRNGVAPSGGTGGTALMASQGFVTNANTAQPSGGQFSEWPQNQQPAYIQQWNLTVETALNSVTSLSIGYVGQSGQHLIDYGNANQFTLAQVEDLANNPNPVPAADLTPYYNLAAGTSYAAGNGGLVLITESRAKSNYNGLQATLRQRQKYGLEYNINYTFAKSMTNAAGNYGAPNVSQTGGDQTFQDYYNSQADYGVSGDDIRNQLNALIVYALPYGHGRQFGAHSNIFLNEALGGWSISNAFRAFSGVPVTITANGTATSATISEGGERANQYSKIRVVNRSLNNWFGTDPSAQPCRNTAKGTVPDRSDHADCAYGQPAQFQFGTAANGTERAPDFYQLDTSLFKDFTTFREESLGFRADFFNILNKADYGNPDNNIQDSNFGQINNVRNQERRIQLSLNYKF